jgi:hypothetical protein
VKVLQGLSDIEVFEVEINVLRSRFTTAEEIVETVDFFATKSGNITQ